MNGRRLILVQLLLSMAAFTAGAQEIRDTLRSSRIVSDRSVRDAGTRIVALPELRSMVSATGDASSMQDINSDEI